MFGKSLKKEEDYSYLYRLQAKKKKNIITHFIDLIILVIIYLIDNLFDFEKDPKIIGLYLLFALLGMLLNRIYMRSILNKKKKKLLLKKSSFNDEINVCEKCQEIISLKILECNYCGHIQEEVNTAKLWAIRSTLYLEDNDAKKFQKEAEFFLDAFAMSVKSEDHLDKIFGFFKQYPNSVLNSNISELIFKLTGDSPQLKKYFQEFINIEELEAYDDLNEFELLKIASKFEFHERDKIKAFQILTLAKKKYSNSPSMLEVEKREKRLKPYIAKEFLKYLLSQSDQLIYKTA